MKNKQLSTIANKTYSSRIIIINTSSRFFQFVVLVLGHSLKAYYLCINILQIVYKITQAQKIHYFITIFYFKQYHANIHL